MTPNALAFRLIAGAALWSAIALLAGGLVLAAAFQDSVERSFDNSLIALWESLVADIDVDNHGRLVSAPDLSDPRFEAAYSGWYWQIVPPGGGPIGSRSLWGEHLNIPAGVEARDYVRAYVTGPDNQDLRMVARNIRLPGGAAPFTVAIAADRSQTAQEVARFNKLLAWAFALLGAGLLIAMVIQVRVGLLPLRRVSAALARIRSGRAERLEGRFPDEIAPLADELNALIAHNAKVLDRARTQVGNLAHALKTPLTVLSNESRYGDSELRAVVEKQTALMRAQIDHYLARARTAAAAQVIGARTPVKPVVDSLARTLGKLYQDKNLKISVYGESGFQFRGERQDLEEMIGNLMDNACKWAASRVDVTLGPGAVKSVDGQNIFRIRIADDGPGLSAEQRSAAVARGARLDQSRPGSGLGLSIVTEIAELYGGTLELEDAQPSSANNKGLSACLTLPRAV